MESGVSMTPCASSWRAREHKIGMAILTRKIGVRAIQLEGKKIVIKGRRLPTTYQMTGGTILPSFSRPVDVTAWLCGKTHTAGETLSARCSMMDQRPS